MNKELIIMKALEIVPCPTYKELFFGQLFLQNWQSNSHTLKEHQPCICQILFQTLEKEQVLFCFRTLEVSDAHQLTVAKASLGWAGAGATFHPLLFTFGWPCRKHGGVNRKGSLTEILVLQTIFSSNSSGWVVRQKAEKNSGRQ